LQGPLKGTLAPFFPAAILDRVQIAEVGVIQNPPFRDEAIDRGIPPNAIAFTQMEGFTLDVVLTRTLKRSSSMSWSMSSSMTCSAAWRSS
jgi:hypothetical protein